MLGRGSEYVSPQRIPSDAALTDMNLQLAYFGVNYLPQEIQTPPACVELTLHILCLVAVPPCNETTALPLLLCPETCHTYEKLISTGLCDDFMASIMNLLERAF